MDGSITTDVQAVVDTVAAVFRCKCRLSKAEAEDLRSDLLLHLIEKDAAGFAEKLENSHYLKAVVNNRARNWMRDTCRVRCMETLDDRRLASDPLDNGHDHVLAQDLLLSLTQQQRIVIGYWFGIAVPGVNVVQETHDIRKVAKLVGVTRGQAKHLLDDAMARMRR